MSINFETGVNVTQTSTQALSSGSIGLRPIFNPAFCAYGANAAAQATVVTWASKEFDILNNFSTSTNRFTASVAGTYYFKYHQLCNYATAGEYRVNIRLNAVSQWGRSIFYKPNASAYSTIQCEAKIVMAVNDYVDVYIETAPAAMAADAGWAFFQGYKI